MDKLFNTDALREIAHAFMSERFPDLQGRHNKIIAAADFIDAHQADLAPEIERIVGGIEVIEGVYNRYLGQRSSGEQRHIDHDKERIGILLTAYHQAIARAEAAEAVINNSPGAFQDERLITKERDQLRARCEALEAAVDAARNYRGAVTYARTMPGLSYEQKMVRWDIANKAGDLFDAALRDAGIDDEA